MDELWQFIKDNAAAISAIAAVAAVLATIVGLLVSLRTKKRRATAGVLGENLKSGRDIRAQDRTGQGVAVGKAEAGRDIELTSEVRRPKA